jgi:hypothetical protein
VSLGEILLIAVVILVPLTIAIVVTLWTLQPAVLRAERAKRSKRRADRAKTQEQSINSDQL